MPFRALPAQKRASTLKTRWNRAMKTQIAQTNRTKPEFRTPNHQNALERIKPSFPHLQNAIPSVCGESTGGNWWLLSASWIMHDVTTSHYRLANRKSAVCEFFLYRLLLFYEPDGGSRTFAHAVARARRKLGLAPNVVVTRWSCQLAWTVHESRRLLKWWESWSFFEVATQVCLTACVEHQAMKLRSKKLAHWQRSTRKDNLFSLQLRSYLPTAPPFTCPVCQLSSASSSLQQAVFCHQESTGWFDLMVTTRQNEWNFRNVFTCGLFAHQSTGDVLSCTTTASQLFRLNDNPPPIAFIFSFFNGN